MNHDCGQASRWVSDRLDRDLGWGERLQLLMHLAMCGACRSNARAMGLLHRMMGAYSADAAVDEAVEPKLDAADRQRIAAALRQEGGADRQR